jgi:hypothetical protein
MALAFADAGADVAINYVTNEPAAIKLVQAIEAKTKRRSYWAESVVDDAGVIDLRTGKSRIIAAPKAACCPMVPPSSNVGGVGEPSVTAQVARQGHGEGLRAPALAEAHTSIQ